MKAKIIKSIFLLIFSIYLVSCDTNDNNDPSISCNANFYTMASTHWDSTLGNFDILQYQKSTTLSVPNNLSTGNNFVGTSSMLILMNSAINTNLGKIVYQFGFEPIFYTFDLNNNTVSTSPYPGGFHPEYLGNNLYFLKIDNIINSGDFLQSGDCNIIDSQGNNVGNPLTNVNFSNTGLFTQHYIISTSNNQDKLYYLANTKLIEYDNLNNTWKDHDLEVYNDNTNKVIFKGLEYVDDNTLYALRGHYTTLNSTTLELVKIDISGVVPQVSVLKDLTNQLSATAVSIINANNWISSSYDSCDDSYYFTYSNVGALNSTIFEIKLISNVINEYPANGKILFGLDKD